MGQLRSQSGSLNNARLVQLVEPLKLQKGDKTDVNLDGSWLMWITVFVLERRGPALLTLIELSISLKVGSRGG